MSCDHKCPATIDLRRIERGGSVLPAIRITRQRLLARPGAARTACPGKQEHSFTSPIGQTSHWIRNASPLQAIYRGSDCPGHQRRNYALRASLFSSLYFLVASDRVADGRFRAAGSHSGPPLAQPSLPAGPMVVRWRRNLRAGSRDPQEAVEHIVCICVRPRDHPGWVDHGGHRALSGAGTRTWNVELADSAVASPDAAVVSIVCVGVGANNHPPRGYSSGACTLAGAGARAGRIELRDSAFRSAQKSVKRAARVNVPACSRRSHADVLIESALKGTCARARTSKVVKPPSRART